ncbi:MAG: GNAT family N-acetyltransferase [Draconibacterium sp.]
MEKHYKFTNNETARQYEFHIDGFIPRIAYVKSGNKIYLTHTEVPPELGGKGIGKALVEMVLEDIRQKGMLLVPLCPFVVKYLKRHPEWEFLVFNDEN